MKAHSKAMSSTYWLVVGQWNGLAVLAGPCTAHTGPGPSISRARPLVL